MFRSIVCPASATGAVILMPVPSPLVFGNQRSSHLVGIISGGRGACTRSVLAGGTGNVVPYVGHVAPEVWAADYDTRAARLAHVGGDRNDPLQDAQKGHRRVLILVKRHSNLVWTVLIAMVADDHRSASLRPWTNHYASFTNRSCSRRM